ncbi:hypothetical protein Gogos_021704 [Gossypium gossypioides]|uniref:Tobamovirus multiplication protein 2A n=1 Tax=Gossypium gossypioides TaxID=34282 RepID=A0A7J9D7J1_GOSGO|nr:hypothetical protein [Gossypium gossypioides]
MACKGCLECLLKLLNFLMTLVGLAMVGYGIYLFVEYKRAADVAMLLSPAGTDQIQLGNIVFTVGGLVDLGGAGMCCFHILRQKLERNKTGYFDMIYQFLEENWSIVKWVALGIVVLEAIIFLLALMVRAANVPADYDSDDEFIAPRQQIRQPLINRPPIPATGVPVTGSLDQRPSRNDAWSARMREKYGLDTSEFTYNPSESNRYQQAAPQPAEESGRCTIM